LYFGQTTSAYQSYLRRYFDELPNISETGAYSVNKDWELGEAEDYYIEQQRYGADYIEAGVILGDKALIDAGTQMIDWGFSRQEMEGGYSSSGDAVHSVSLFLEAAGRASLALQMYDASAYAELLEKWRNDLLIVGKWFIQNHKDGQESNLIPFAHRYFLRAAALQSAYEVTGFGRFKRAARKYVREGLAMQRETGEFLERGTYDASYHMVGVAFAGRYYALSKHDRLKGRVLDSVSLAVERFREGVSAKGEVYLSEDSRTVTELSREGVAKTFDFKHTSKALNFTAIMLEQPEIEQMAHLILSYYDKM